MISFKDLWSIKFRPVTLDEIYLTDEIRSFFEGLKKDNSTIPNIILYGGPGIGKSTLGGIIVNDILHCEHIVINASQESTIDVIKNTVQNFIQTKSFLDKPKVVIMEEAESLSYSANGGRSGSQNALKQMMEDYSTVARFIFTTNNITGITEPIISRCVSFNLAPTNDQILKKCIFILKSENVKVSDVQKKKVVDLIKQFSPDYRKIINHLQLFTINGELNIPEKIDNLKLVENIYNDLLIKKDLFEIRKTVIENESKFKSDYKELLKGLFELFYKGDLTISQKKKILIVLGEGLKDSIIVMDKEINFFCVLIRINMILEEK